MWKDSVDKESIEFVLETNKRCAKCGKNAFNNFKKKTKYKYMIVSIYPPLLSDEVAEVYNEI
ncbi:hypothetical protein [Metamycoplasma hominis]|uniref:Uncharacterized protein n=1 Tax=Metamycoplasma hominis TaxID=2098 RepID=A0A454C9S9_METHO|nr:hypothetical protein [Metamycoplasma hominis]AYN65477.1 hypothetical protein KN71_002115 [Metamycoplasma hominis]QKX36725.1 hypothetical protein HU153_01965 [Metamycoplasma hominis]QKX38967.1 hypothetical protein HU157_01895 [Metamycoplasma hominis]